MHIYEEKQGIIGDVKTQQSFHTKAPSPPTLTVFSNAFLRITAVLPLACKQAIRGTLSAGWEKKVELTTRSLEFEFRLQFPYGSSSTELSDFRQSA